MLKHIQFTLNVIYVSFRGRINTNQLEIIFDHFKFNTTDYILRAGLLIAFVVLRDTLLINSDNNFVVWVHSNRIRRYLSLHCFSNQ